MQKMMTKTLALFILLSGFAAAQTTGTLTFEADEPLVTFNGFNKQITWDNQVLSNQALTCTSTGQQAPNPATRCTVVIPAALATMGTHSVSIRVTSGNIATTTSVANLPSGTTAPGVLRNFFFLLEIKADGTVRLTPVP